MEKKAMLIYIDMNIEKKLRNLIQNKYEHYQKGLLSYEVELAIRNWLALHTQTQKIKNNAVIQGKPNPLPNVIIAFQKVKEYLLGKYYDTLFQGQQINYKHLEEAIMNTRGVDKRTIRKWLKIFHKMGFIKPITPMIWEIL